MALIFTNGEFLAAKLGVALEWLVFVLSRCGGAGSDAFDGTLFSGILDQRSLGLDCLVPEVASKAGPLDRVRSLPTDAEGTLAESFCADVMDEAWESEVEEANDDDPTLAEFFLARSSKARCFFSSIMRLTSSVEAVDIERVEELTEEDGAEKEEGTE